MKKKQSIIGTFYLNIAVVILTSLVILSALTFSHMVASHKERSFVELLSNISLQELGLTFIFSILSTVIISKFLAIDLGKHFSLFTSYFEKATHNLERIETGSLKYREFDSLALSVNSMLTKLEASQEAVEYQKSYLQAVLETQKDMIMVISDGEIKSVNRAFLEFFSVPNIQAFYNTNAKLCDLFVEEEGYVGCNREGLRWKEYIYAHPDIMHKIKLEYKEVVSIFRVYATKIVQSEEVLVSFSDITEVENERKRFEKVASTDALTGIANRLKFNTILEQQIAMAKRYKEPFSVILFDVDNFKQVNDTYGHKVGDEVLISLAKEVSSNIRASDTFARWGGEEFVLILPQTKEQEAYLLAEKLRKKIAKISFSKSFHVTCSFGVSEYTKEEDSDTFIQSVDWLLYKAKHSGKNRVCLA